MNLADLYRQMIRAREYELAVGELWSRGLISGEMHAGTGEEAIAAGVVGHLGDRDALALAHRCSPYLVARGVPLVPMLKELLGREDGLCRGRGGHMHLFSPGHRAATSGIVGASLPTGAGFALAAKRLRPGAIAVALTGTGALNQGMALETLNLAPAWSLPLLVVCVYNGWAITTPDGAMTGGDLRERAGAFGWEVATADGTDVAAVYQAAGGLIERLREGKGPGFLYVECPRMDGHFLGDPLIRAAREPLVEGREMFGGVVDGAFALGGGLVARTAGLAKLIGVLVKARAEPRHGGRRDPVEIARRKLEKAGEDYAPIDAEARREVARAVEIAKEDRNGRA